MSSLKVVGAKCDQHEQSILTREEEVAKHRQKQSELQNQLGEKSSQLESVQKEA